MIVKVCVFEVVGQTGERRSVRNWSFNCGGMTKVGLAVRYLQAYVINLS